MNPMRFDSLHYFLLQILSRTPECFLFQLSLWINEKMLTAQDMSYDEARNLHSKWLKHQAFMAELASNKEWLEKIEKVTKECPKRAPSVSEPVMHKE